jgi:hypothetical protein
MIARSTTTLAIFVSLLIPSISNADSCESLYQLTCQTAAKSAEGRFEDETGYSVRYNKNREIKRIIESNQTILNESVQAFVAAIADRKQLIPLLPYLPTEIKANCRELNAGCREALNHSLAELLQFDLSGAVLFKDKFEATKLGILNAHDDYNRMRTDVLEKIKDAKDSALEKKLNNEIFPLIIEQVQKVIRDLLLESPEREQMLERVAQVRYAGDLCRPMIYGRPDLPSISQNGAVYDSEENSVQLCRGFLGANTSLFSLYYTIAREVAHSIDPCTLKKIEQNPTLTHEPVQKSPWYPLMSCLANERSLGDAVGKQVSSRVQNPKLCTQEPMNHALADFVATEVIAQLMTDSVTTALPQSENGLANAWRPSCGTPSASSRIDRILVAHPVVRDILGCSTLPTERTYCGHPEKWPNREPSSQKIRKSPVAKKQ